MCVTVGASVGGGGWVVVVLSMVCVCVGSSEWVCVCAGVSAGMCYGVIGPSYG